MKNGSGTLCNDLFWKQCLQKIVLDFINGGELVVVIFVKTVVGSNVNGLGVVEVETVEVVKIQSVSSVPSAQSAKPSHRHLELMHSPFSQVNSFALH